MLLPPPLETPVEDTGVDREEEYTACGEKHAVVYTACPAQKAIQRRVTGDDGWNCAIRRRVITGEAKVHEHLKEQTIKLSEHPTFDKHLQF